MAIPSRFKSIANALAYPIPFDSFTWKENGKPYTSEAAAVLFDTGPEGKPAWILVGTYSNFGNSEYRELVIYIYADDESKPIIDITYKPGSDELSNFWYYRGSDTAFEGDYTVTLTLTPVPFNVKADFRHTLPEVSVTEGKLRAG